MAKHLCKIMILFVPTFASIVLLIFCLTSDWWTQINQVKLDRVRSLYESEFKSFIDSQQQPVNTAQQYELVNGNKNSDPTTSVVLKKKEDESNVIKNTNNFSTMTTTTITNKKNMDNDEMDDESLNENDENDNNDASEDNSEDYNENDDEQAKKKKLRKKRQSSNEDADEGTSAENYDYQENDETATTTKSTTTSTKKQLITSSVSNTLQQIETSSIQAIKNIKEYDYVYITKLWPFTTAKSLFSECTKYEKLTLKISIAYLNQANKEPIVGHIHYGNNILNRHHSTTSSATSCNGKIGMTRCIMTDECVTGAACDGVVDCRDQSDEQFCENKICRTQNGGFQCDNRCWQYWNKCDQIPHCFNLTDELAADCPTRSFKLSTLFTSPSNFTFIHKNFPFQLGQSHYVPQSNCFKSYFDFKSAKLIKKESLKYLSQSLADNIQEANNINYHLQLIYSLAFLSAFGFCLLALMSLLFISCFSKLCLQCPFWFFGFFQMLSCLASTFGIMTYLYQWFSNKHRALDPNIRLPIENEILRLNSELLMLEEFGVAFWVAVGATGASLLSSLLSCIVCCRLPSTRHEDKEYKIMQLPAYT